MYNDNDFDFGVELGDVEESKDFSAMPAGDYPMQAIEFEVKQTKDKMGDYISAQFEVVGGNYNGRKVFENYNVKNASAKAVQIALSNLKSLVVACGGTGQERLTLSLLNGFRGTEFTAKLGIEKDDRGEKNRIKAYKPAGIAVTHQSPAKAATQAAPAASKTQRPWERK